MSKKKRVGLSPFDQRIFGIIEELGEDCFTHPEVGEDVTKQIKKWRKDINDPTCSDLERSKAKDGLKSALASLGSVWLGPPPKKGRPRTTSEDERGFWKPLVEKMAPEALEEYRTKRDQGVTRSKAKKEMVQELLVERLAIGQYPTMSQERMDEIRSRLLSISWEHQRRDGFATTVLAIILGHKTPSSSKSTKSRLKKKI